MSRRHQSRRPHRRHRHQTNPSRYNQIRPAQNPQPGRSALPKYDHFNHPRFDYPPTLRKRKPNAHLPPRRREIGPRCLYGPRQNLQQPHLPKHRPRRTIPYRFHQSSPHRVQTPRSRRHQQTRRVQRTRPPKTLQLTHDQRQQISKQCAYCRGNDRRQRHLRSQCGYQRNSKSKATNNYERTSERLQKPHARVLSTAQEPQHHL